DGELPCRYEVAGSISSGSRFVGSFGQGQAEANAVASTILRDEFDPACLERFLNRVEIPCIGGWDPLLAFHSLDRGQAHLGLSRQLPGRPAEQRSRRSDLCACDHDANSIVSDKF